MNSLNGVSRASRSANFSATTAIRLVTARSTESAHQHKEKARPSIAGGMAGRSITRKLFSPGPRRESLTSHRASPAMARVRLDGPQPHRPTPPENTKRPPWTRPLPPPLIKTPAAVVAAPGLSATIGIVMNKIPIPPRPRKPNSATVISTGCCPADWRQWWLAEAERIGTDWRSLFSLHLEICDRLRAASSSWGPL
jgi:hypothetical protein